MQGKKIHLVLCLALIVAYSPLRSLGLVFPLCALFLLLFASGINTGKNLLVFIIFYGACILSAAFYSFINPDFLLPNFIMALITFSGFQLLLFDFRKHVSEKLLINLSKLFINLLFFQAILGIIEFVFNAFVLGLGLDGSTGDAVHGTIALSLVPDSKGSNVMFAVLQSSLLTFYLFICLQFKKKPSYIKTSLVFLSWILASVMHSLVFFFMAFIIVFLLIRSKFVLKRRSNIISRIRLGSIIKVSIPIALVLTVFLASNLSLIVPTLQKTFSNSDAADVSIKTLATVATVSELGEKKPYQRIIGLGPGQYCSRASLILSGEYLDRNLPFGNFMNADLNRYIMPLWLPFKDVFYGSSFFPYYSWLTLYGELGLLGVVVLIFLLIRLLRFSSRTNENVNTELYVCVLIIAFYLMLLGFQDNYWEWTQTIFPVIFVWKLLLDFIRQTKQLPNEGKERTA